MQDMATHPGNEKDVLDQARAGNHAAFEALIRPYHRYLYRRALRMTRNEEDAEDVVQDALLKAYRKLDQFQGSSRFHTWVMRIVINEALMKLRRRRSNPETESLEAPHVGQEQFEGYCSCAPNEQPDKQLYRAELQDILRRAFAVLSPSMGAAFVLRHLEGYSQREVATMLGLSLPATKSRLLRARRGLSNQLSETLGHARPGSRIGTEG
jgi:RNA polymerase sigma-70 factor, ECF subfamily